MSRTESKRPRGVTRRTVLAGSGAAAMAAFLASCTSSTAPGAGGGTTPPADEILPGGQIIFNAAVEPTFLTVLLNGGSTPHYYARFFRNGLVRPDANMEMVPDLAESWTVSPDGKVYTFKLRQNVKWHDGRPFTSADCVAHYEAVVHPKTAPKNTGMSGFFAEIAGAADFTAGKAPKLAGVSAPDANTFVVTLNRAFSPFLALVAAEVIEPKHVIDGVDPAQYQKTDKILRQAIGTGPFKFVEWKSGEFIKMTANPDYFLGKPKYETLIARFAADPTTYPSLMRSGTVDVVGLGETMAVDDVQTFEGDAKFKVDPREGINSHQVSFNTTNPLFADVRVRRALSWAFDRETFVKAFYKGRAVVNDSPIPPSSWGYTEPKVKPKFDVAGAKALLAEAGWVAGSDGILAKGGTKLAFEMIVVDTIQQSWPIALQRAWREIGVQATLTPVAFNALFTRYTAGNFAVAGLWQTIGRYYDPGRIFPNIALNGPRYKDPAADKLIDEQYATSDRAVRKAKLAEITEIFNRDVPYFFVVYPRYDWVMASTVKLGNNKNSVIEYAYAGDWVRLKPKP